MEDKRSLYKEDELLTLDFEDGATIEFGVLGTFELDGTEYIALDTLDDSDDVYLFVYVPTDDDFELTDVPEEDFERVSAEFDRLMEEYDSLAGIPIE